MFSGYSEYQAQQYAAALPKLQPVAAAGNPEAQTMLGALYQLGFDGITIDEAAAIAWYERASAQGYGLASNNLAGMRFMQGDLEAAHRLYQLADEQGFSAGRDFLANYPIPPV